jgi:hydrogenase/urease accessory protein HupE
MTLVAVICSLFIVAVGAIGVVSPPRLVALIRRVQTPAGLYFAAGFRLVFGVALYLAAPASRAPEALHVLGVVAVLAGIATPFFGLARYRQILDWWLARGPGFMRAWAGFALALGALLTYALVT